MQTFAIVVLARDRRRRHRPVRRADRSIIGVMKVSPAGPPIPTTRRASALTMLKETLLTGCSVEGSSGSCSSSSSSGSACCSSRW